MAGLMDAQLTNSTTSSSLPSPGRPIPTVSSPVPKTGTHTSGPRLPKVGSRLSCCSVSIVRLPACSGVPRKTSSPLAAVPGTSEFQLASAERWPKLNRQGQSPFATLMKKTTGGYRSTSRSHCARLCFPLIGTRTMCFSLRALPRARRMCFRHT